MIGIIVLLIVASFARNEELFFFDDVNPNPGIKLSFTEKTINYVMTQSLNWMKEHIGTLHFPDIKEKVDTPIGTLEFDMTYLKMGEIDLGSPTISVISGNEFEFKDSSLHFKMSGKWKWEDHSFPWPFDDGTFDLSCEVSVDSKVGGETDPSKKSGLKIISTHFDLDFKSLDITVHGGASWLYNIMISTFKPIFEDLITVAVDEQIPPIIVVVVQGVMSSMNYDNAVLDDVFFSFIIDNLDFDSQNQFISIGVEGKFHSSEYTYQTLPTPIPSILSTNNMVSLFLSEYTINSCGYVFDSEGLIKYILNKKNLPSKSPIKLNTNYYKLLIPKLYEMYPNMDMQVTFLADPQIYPRVLFSENELMTLILDLDTIFQVVDNATSPTTIVNAFTISLELLLDGSLTIQKDETKENYCIVSNVTFKDMNMTLKQSNIGDINIDLLDETFKFLVHYILIPLINQKLQIGIPFPQIPYFELQNPNVKYHDKFAVFGFDFLFQPPEYFMDD